MYFSVRRFFTTEVVLRRTFERRPDLLRYFVRRVGWHVLDHIWEIEDRAAPSIVSNLAPGMAARKAAP